jgi:hypothetical protein
MHDPRGVKPARTCLTPRGSCAVVERSVVPVTPGVGAHPDDGSDQKGPDFAIPRCRLAYVLARFGHRSHALPTAAAYVPSRGDDWWLSRR